MLRLLLSLIAVLMLAGAAHAAGDIDTCRNGEAEATARLAACETVIADDRITGKSRAAAFGYRGDTLAKKRDYDGAIAAFSGALSADPDNVSYLNSRGVAYSNKGDDQHAMADFGRCIELNPRYSNPYNNRGLIYMRTGELQRALADFNLAVRYTASFAEAKYIHLYNRARVETQLKQYDAALVDFGDALTLKPDGPRVFSLRCITYTEMKKFDEALADCNTALATAPKDVFVLVSRANARFGKGDLAAALTEYNEVLKAAPNNIRGHAGRGLLFEKRGDINAARADYRSASVALTLVDDTETGVARKFARERLAALAPSVANLPPVPPKSAKGTSPAPAPSSEPRKVALIVGNGAYKNVPALDNPPRDARLVASTFRSLGFAVVTLEADLGRDRFFAALRAFGAEAEKSDWAVIYYAGHGMEIGGINYLIPTDARLASDHDADSQAVALEQVIAAVSGARKLRLVMLDACRDNPFEKTMKHTIALKLVNKGLSNIEPEAGFMVVYAAKHGETALDGDAANSPFAMALARDIKEPKVEVRKLFDIVRDDVWTATKHKQQPFTYGSLPGREDFYFVAGK
ncbi:caspase family protein [Bradyrhizobium genosp. L]|uniref:caspase family protein n=1 Tax=Bradyrhizobium genosp. L TaxID=83637 RepID=UPI0018A3170D|nr:caspase family protein [Bradyrhizobium genosp. L]QPF83677.1 caspase family protein [Bradyrhizobium genosp. L]